MVRRFVRHRWRVSRLVSLTGLVIVTRYFSSRVLMLSLSGDRHLLRNVVRTAVRLRV